MEPIELDFKTFKIASYTIIGQIIHEKAHELTIQ